MEALVNRQYPFVLTEEEGMELNQYVNYIAERPIGAL